MPIPTTKKRIRQKIAENHLHKRKKLKINSNNRKNVPNIEKLREIQQNFKNRQGKKEIKRRIDLYNSIDGLFTWRKSGNVMPGND